MTDLESAKVTINNIIELLEEMSSIANDADDDSLSKLQSKNKTLKTLRDNLVDDWGGPS